MTSLDDLVGITHALYKWFGLMDDAGLDQREMFADSVLPVLAELDRNGAFMTVREEFLDRANALLDSGGRFFDPAVEDRVRGTVEAVRTTLQADVLRAKLTEWV